jgi:glutathione synthase
MAEHLYICNSLDELQPGADTTLALARASRAAGRVSNWCLMNEMRWHEGRLLGRIRPFDESMQLHEGSWRPLNDQELVFVRTDPPVDASYLAALWLLDAAAKQGLRVINRPSSLCYANEKTLILNFPELIPPTLVCGDAGAIRSFVDTHGRAVIKPLDGNGGRGVLLLAGEDKNLNAIIEISLAPQAPVMVQAFLPAVSRGDRRVLLVDGEPLGVLNRVAGDKDFRCNMHVGAAAEWVPLDDDDRRVCSALKPYFQAHGLVFAGIDIIGGRLTEINVTSPTGVEEILATGGPDVGAATIEHLIGLR